MLKHNISWNNNADVIPFYPMHFAYFLIYFCTKIMSLHIKSAWNLIPSMTFAYLKSKSAKILWFESFVDYAEYNEWCILNFNNLIALSRKNHFMDTLSHLQQNYCLQYEYKSATYLKSKRYSRLMVMNALD